MGIMVVKKSSFQTTSLKKAMFYSNFRCYGTMCKKDKREKKYMGKTERKKAKVERKGPSLKKE